MIENKKPVDIEQIACEICMREVPKSEATTPEATDYVVHFCGLSCYEEWQKQNSSTPEK
jgi:hypothetical protein